MANHQKDGNIPGNPQKDIPEQNFQKDAPTQNPTDFPLSLDQAAYLAKMQHKSEMRYRSRISLLLKQCVYPKEALRDLIVGYYVNEEGLATTPPDENGHRELATFNGEPEEEPGDFIRNRHLEALHLYQGIEIWRAAITREPSERAMVELKDQNGTTITKIYRDDTKAIKEILENWDMPIGDPINDLYAFLAGHQEGALLPRVGLAHCSDAIASAYLKDYKKRNRRQEKTMFQISQNHFMERQATLLGEISDKLDQVIRKLDKAISKSSDYGPDEEGL